MQPQEGSWRELLLLEEAVAILRQPWRFPATMSPQLADISSNLRRRIGDAVASNRRIHGLGLYDQWEKLILQPLSQLGQNTFSLPLVIVVDALDECDNEDDVSY